MYLKWLLIYEQLSIPLLMRKLNFDPSIPEKRDYINLVLVCLAVFLLVSRVQYWVHVVSVHAIPENGWTDRWTDG